MSSILKKIIYLFCKNNIPSSKNKSFLVEIHYKEPLFCKTIGKDPDTIFIGTFDIIADDKETARQIAINEFHLLASRSNVHWERKIVESFVKPK